MDNSKAPTYAMAKKVARPARISVKKYEPFLSLGWLDKHHVSNRQLSPFTLQEALTWPDPSSRNHRPKAVAAIF